MDIQYELNLLYEDPLFANIKPPVPPATDTDRMVEKLEAINAFVRQYGVLPKSDGVFEEKRLARSLQALRSAHNTMLKEFDEFNLLDE